LVTDNKKCITTESVRAIRKGVRGFRLTGSISLETSYLNIGQSYFHSGSKFALKAFSKVNVFNKKGLFSLVHWM
jgi:hypothetical protein